MLLHKVLFLSCLVTGSYLNMDNFSFTWSRFSFFPNHVRVLQTTLCSHKGSRMCTDDVKMAFYHYYYFRPYCVPVQHICREYKK